MAAPEERVGNTVQEAAEKNNKSTDTVVAKVATLKRNTVGFDSSVSNDVAAANNGWTVVPGRKQTRPGSHTPASNEPPKQRGRMSPCAHSLV